MAAKAKKEDNPEDRLTRIAIVDADKCKPKKCRQECKKSCPVVKMGTWNFLLTMVSFFLHDVTILDQLFHPRSGKLCIEVEPTSATSFISEALCIGCNICVKVFLIVFPLKVRNIVPNSCPPAHSEMPI